MAAAHRLLALPILPGSLRHLALLLPLVSGADVPPHNDTESVARLVFGGPAIELVLELDTDHLMMAVEAKPPLGEDWSEEELRAIEPAALEYLAGHWQLTAGGLPLLWTPRGFELLRAFDPLLQQERAMRVALRFSLPAPEHDVEATLVETIFAGIEPGHRHWLELAFPGRPPNELRVAGGLPFRFLLPDLGPGATQRRLVARAVTGAAASFASPWLLLFVAALLVAPAPAREQARAVAAAFCACAAAFALARADVIAPAPWAATAAAAFSVAYVAAENRLSRSVKLRVATAALFGLVHGMALAPRLGLQRAGVVLPPSLLENAVFSAAALLVAAAAAAGCALVTQTLRRLFPRFGIPVFDLLLILAGTAGVVVAIAQRGAAAA